MRIIHIPRRFVKNEWGGTETVILESSKELLKEGHEVEIATSLALSKKRKERVYGIKVRRFGYSYTRLGLNRRNKTLLDKRAGDLYSLGLFFYLLFVKNVKLFHLSTMGRVGALVRLVSKIRKIPYILTIQGGHQNIPRKQMNEMLKPLKGTFNWGKIFDVFINKNKLFDDAKKVICVGKKEKELLEKRHPKANVVYSPNGVDIKYFQKGNAKYFRNKYNLSKKIILCVSRICHQKNQLHLIEEFSKIKGVELVLIGHVTNKEYMNAVIEKIKSLKLQKSVRILTDINFSNPDLVNAYAAADIFVLPSIHEPFGIVILEAWSARIPVIASKVGGILDFVKHKDNGILYDNDLSEQINILLKDKKLRSKIIKNASRDVKKYSWENVVKQIYN